MMKVRDQYIVNVHGKWQILYSTPTRYFITTNGAFGQRETYIEEISDEEAIKLKRSDKNKTP